MIDFIIQTCHSFTNISALEVLCYAYVRSSLEYYSLIRNPFYQIHPDSFVQRPFEIFSL